MSNITLQYCREYRTMEHIAVDDGVDVNVVDVTEHPVERPKKQEQWYSGKKKQHTVKSQIDAVIDEAAGKVHRVTKTQTISSCVKKRGCYSLWRCVVAVRKV
jgi:hypothetical protein